MYHYRKTMTLSAFRITRFQFARDRIDRRQPGAHGRRQCSSPRADCRRRPGRARLHPGAVAAAARPGRDRAHLPAGGLARSRRPAWRSPLPTGSAGRAAATSAPSSLPFREAIQVALWDLAAKQAGLPLHRLLGSRARPGQGLCQRARLSSLATRNSRACSPTPPSSATAPSRSRSATTISTATCTGSIC